MKKIISNLFPSFFDTSEGSNISKIIQIFSEEIESFRGDATKVDSWKMIDAAKGETLDKIGEQYGEFRGAADDEFYRYLIKSKIAQRSVDGSTNKIISIVNQTLNVPLDEIRVKKTREGPIDESNFQTIGIEGLPQEYFLSTNLAEKFIERISNSVAAGVSLDRIFFDSNNDKTIYCAVGLVATEMVMITHDRIAAPELPVLNSSNIGGVSTTFESWSSDANINSVIDLSAKETNGFVHYESVEIH